MAKQTKADESRTKMDQETREADLARHEKNASPATQGGADDPKSRGDHNPKEGGQSKQSAKSSGFQDAIQQIAQATKTLTENGCGGQQAAQIALEVWKESK